MKRFFVKATSRESGTPRRSANWALARRGWFTIFDDRVECGDWTIPFQAVNQAILYQGRQFLLAATVLELRTSTGTYQFGFNPWVNLERHLPLQFERLRVRYGYSPFSLVIRFILLGYLAFMVWRWLG